MQVFRSRERTPRLRGLGFLLQEKNAGLVPCPFRFGQARKGELMPTLSKLLLENGLPDRPVLEVEPHRNHRWIWRIKFSFEMGEPFSMAATQASIMVSHLHEIGEVELAEEIDDAVRAATRYATM